MDDGGTSSILLCNLKAARSELRLASAEAQQQGDRLISEGLLKNPEIVKPGSKYTIQVGGEDPRRVQIRYHHGRGRWETACDCSAPEDGELCVHGYAALKSLIEAHVSGKAAKQPTTNLAENPAVEPKPSDAPVTFIAKVERVLGRPLVPTETQFLDRLKQLHVNLKRTQFLHNADLYSLGIRAPGLSWDRLNIFPQIPETEEQLWLFISHHLAQFGLKGPSFLDSATDFSLIETQLENWRRQREVKQWSDLLARTSYEEPLEVDAPVRVELRLRLGTSEAFVESRTDAKGEFTPIKPKKFVEFDQRHSDQLVPEVGVLWQTFVQRAKMGYSLELQYQDAFTKDALNRLLRLPLLNSFIVGKSGAPLERVPETLSWNMSPPEAAGDYYVLQLVAPGGGELKDVCLRLPGRPMLFVTSDKIYSGPAVPTLGFDPLVQTRIPAAALETLQGLKFLQQIQAPLPERLASRMRKVTLTPLLRAEISAPYAGNDAEYCFLDILAESPQTNVRERWNGSNWTPLIPELNAARQPSEGDAAPDGVYEILDHSKLGNLPSLVEAGGFRWDYTWQRWSMRLTKKFPESFVPFIQSLPPEIRVELRGELNSFLHAEVSGEIRLDVQETGIDWFDLKVLVNVSDTTLSAEEIKLLLDARGKWVRLGEKGWRKLEFQLSKEEDEELARLGLNPHQLTSEPQRLHALQLADPGAKRFLDREKFEQVQRRARELQARVTPEVPKCIRAELRPYQMEGFHFLAYLSSNRFGGILADDMGLGKTIQTLTWLAWLREQAAAEKRGDSGSVAPVLVVCPKSVCDNWRAEGERFVAGLRIRVWGGDEVKSLRTSTDTADIHIINYAQLRTIGESLAKIDFLAVILDEGQYIKNPTSMTAIIARTLQTQHRLVLSGTPIENRLLDLWSLMSFAMPGALGGRTEFSRLFDVKGDPFARRRLSARVRPFLLRRTKTQVAKDLPDRVEEDLFCELEGEQKSMYRAELKRAQQSLLGITSAAALNKQRFNVLTSLLRLRQICCHPKLIHPDAKAGSAKMEALIETIEPLMEEGQKVLVFSQFVGALDLIEKSVTEQGWKSFYLAGETEDRGSLVKSFQSYEGAAVFLISLKAGGFGLNLTASSYVVLFDPWWNPAVENQAIDRTHRIGQKQKVIAYRLLIKDSIEEKIRKLQQTKSELADAILGEERFAQGLSLEDLRFLFSD